MVKITKPKEKYGYYCDLCGAKICKYSADYRDCWGVNVDVFDPEQIDQVMQNHDICHDCAKVIMEELLDLHDL